MKVEANLHQLGLPSGTFDAIVVGEEVAHKKSGPRYFPGSWPQLGLDPSVCLVIEDAVSGVAAAKAAGPAASWA